MFSGQAATEHCVDTGSNSVVNPWHACARGLLQLSRVSVCVSVCVSVRGS